MSRRKLRVAVLSFWHVHAKDYAKQAMEHPDTELVAVWDELPERGSQEAAARGVPFVEKLDDVLGDASIDGVIVTTATINHPEIIIAAAKAGKHIFTEKVIALTAQECDRIMEAINEAGVTLTVSLPRLNTPFTQGALGLIASGMLGELTLVRARLAHSGALPCEASPLGYLPSHFFDLEQTGGGALIDLGCHPMYTVRLLLGMPQSLYASFGYITSKAVEDNAAVTLNYNNGAIGIVEAAFVNSASPFTLELHGTKGSAIYSAKDAKFMYKSAQLNGELAKQWHEYELPAALPSAFEQWTTHIETGTKAEQNISIALELTELMEAAAKSAQTGQVIHL